MPTTMPTPIHPESPADLPAIDALTRAAFATHPHSQQTEHLIVRALRDAGALSVSLVARDGAAVLGHVAFSPVQVGDGSAGWFGLGPVSVLPARQGRGIGSALVRAGLDVLRGRGAAGCVVLGEPGYYGRFGFVASGRLTLPGVPADHFMDLPLAGSPAFGEVRFHAAFEVAPEA